MMKRFLSLGLLSCLWPNVAGAVDLDAVFVLDTTGSMSAEIREVQERVVELADSLARARAGERIRFGVVAYRDRGDDYVTRTSPLMEDVEQSRRFLASLAAGGGGDGPESVVAALTTALDEMSWELTEATDRQIFLIGDAPPHLDYGDEATPEELVQRAREKRVVINTIGCRSLPPHGVAFFRRMAYETEGSYQHIGRVRGEASGALTEAMSRAASLSGDTRVGEDVPLTWERHEGGSYSSVLVRQGGPEGSEQDPDGGSLPPCVLEIRLPDGLALGADPRAKLGEHGLEVGLDVVEGSGGRDLYRLTTCPPLSTPIHVSLGGL